MADWRGALMSAVCYQDPKAAIRWLEAAFGFELFMLIEDGEGRPRPLRNAFWERRGDDRQ